MMHEYISERLGICTIINWEDNYTVIVMSKSGKYYRIGGLNRLFAQRNCHTAE